MYFKHWTDYVLDDDGSEPDMTLDNDDNNGYEL